MAEVGMGADQQSVESCELRASMGRVNASGTNSYDREYKNTND